MLSVVAIAKNEIKNIPGFIASWSAVADEIVILDTGSTDGSWELLCGMEEKNDKLSVHRTEWMGDFSAARNRASRFASGKWILWADLDDRLDTASIERIKALAKPSPTMAYKFQVASDMGGGRWQRFLQVRMFPNWPSMRFSGAVHETLEAAIQAAGIPIFDEPEIIVAHLGYADENLKQQKAARNLGMLMEIHPKTVDNLIQIGDALYILGKFFVGLGYYEEACRQSPPEMKSLLAEKLIIGYLSVSALEKARLTLFSLPDRSVSRLYWTGELHFLQGDYDDARNLFADAISVGDRWLERGVCNGDILIDLAKKRLIELEAKCVLA